jgi:hypothetical protein
MRQPQDLGTDSALTDIARSALKEGKSSARGTHESAGGLVGVKCRRHVMCGRNSFDLPRASGFGALPRRLTLSHKASGES